MQFTEPQINNGILAIVRTWRRDFDSLSNAEKTSLGQGTWLWFGPILDNLPPDASVEDFTESWEMIRGVAQEYLISARKAGTFNGGEHSPEEVEAMVNSETMVEEQARLFLRLGQVGLEAITAQRDLQAMVDNFAELDLNAELKQLLLEEGK